MRISILAFFLVLVPGCADETEPEVSSTPTVDLVPGAERIGMSLASLSAGLEDHRQAVLRVTDVRSTSSTACRCAATSIGSRRVSGTSRMCATRCSTSWIAIAWPSPRRPM